ncbi:MAG: hypothetical protein ACRCXX_13915 [Cetobacterium sp.]|uniref:hypothetical protein n=1 Tax=Cetobacterium sp. TaxID=2071632 RepID=UPI003F362058
MKNAKIEKYKEKVKSLGYEIIEEKDKDYFSFVNKENGVIMSIYDNKPEFGLFTLSTAHYPQRDHGHGWVYLRNVYEIDDAEFKKAEDFIIKKFNRREEKRITVEEFLDRCSR